MKKIAIFTTTRSDISILIPLIKKIRKSKKMNYLLFVGGTHLNKNYGNTKKEILLDKISIHGYFDYLAKGDSKKSLSLSNKFFTSLFTLFSLTLSIIRSRLAK